MLQEISWLVVDTYRLAKYLSSLTGLGVKIGVYKTVKLGKLCHHIAWCNELVNKNKLIYHSNLGIKSGQDPRKLHKALNIFIGTTVPSHKLNKSLADRLGIYFQEKISKIRDCFLPLTIRTLFFFSANLSLGLSVQCLLTQYVKYYDFN